MLPTIDNWLACRWLQRLSWRSRDLYVLFCRIVHVLVLGPWIQHEHHLSPTKFSRTIFLSCQRYRKLTTTNYRMTARGILFLVVVLMTCSHVLAQLFTDCTLSSTTASCKRCINGTRSGKVGNFITFNFISKKVLCNYIRLFNKRI